VPPGGVGIGELGVGTLAATLAHEPLAVGVGGHVGAVDGDVAAKLGKLRVQAGGHAVKAPVEHVAVEAELGREAVAGVDGWDRGTLGDGGAQGRVLTDERDCSSPRRTA
jgi:hypothetical protein